MTPCDKLGHLVAVKATGNDAGSLWCLRCRCKLADAQLGLFG